jgi:hypothetical protein
VLSHHNAELLTALFINWNDAGLGIESLPGVSCTEALREGRLLPLLPQWRPAGFFGERVYHYSAK